MTDVLFPGCTVQARLPFVESAFRFILEKLNMKMDDLPDDTCCMEPTGLRAMNQDSWLAVNARHHSIASGRRLVTLCEGCNLSLSESAEILRENENAEIVKGVLPSDRESTISDVSGTLQFIHENIETISKMITNPVDLKLAMFPGCHCEYVCWKNGNSAILMMQSVLEAIGAKPLRATEDMCCGGTLSMIEPELEKNILSETISSFRDTGSDAVVTSCPFCFMRFDMVGKFRTYHIAEVVAMSLGWEDPLKYHTTK